MVCRGKFPILLPSQKYREWHNDAVTQLLGKDKIIANRLTLIIFAPDARKADLTNKAESIMDLLVGCKLIEDDNWYVIGEVVLKFGGIDKKNPRCEIEY